MADQKVKCPKAERLRELILSISDQTPEADEIAGALDWLAQFLEDRALYHKRQQLKNKHLMRLAKEHGLLTEASEAAEPELLHHILNQEPTNDD